MKTHQIIMLPTENESQGIYLSPIPSINKIHYWDKRISNSYIAQNLYIISEDKIGEGDWYYNSLYNEVRQCSNTVKFQTVNYINNGIEKPRNHLIVVTTDSSLKVFLTNSFIGKSCVPQYTYLPQLSKQFIEKYIESYNKGEIINDVLVEYIGKTIQTYPRSGRDCGGNEIYEYIEVLKVNKDNTVNVRLKQFPIVGGKYLYKQRAVYTVYDITNEHSTKINHPPTVCFIGDNGRKWSRPVSEWGSSYVLLNN